MLSTNSFGNRFHTFHHGRSGSLERHNGEDEEELLASIRPPSVLFGAEIMPLRPYVPWERNSTPSQKRAPTPIGAGQSMKRDNRPPSMDLFVTTPQAIAPTAPPLATGGETTPTGFLDSEMPPVSPFFARITSGDIKEARETVRRASVTRRNTLQAIATPARTSIAGTLTGWVPPDHQRWDPQALETPSRSRHRASFGRRNSTWHLLEEDAHSNGSADGTSEWLRDQEPPLSPLFTSYNTDRLRGAARVPPLTQRLPPVARLFQVDIYALFTSPLCTRQQRKPRVVVYEIMGGGTGNSRLVPVDATDPDVLAAVKQYLTTLPPFDQKTAGELSLQRRRDPTKMAVPSKRNAEDSSDVSHFSEPTVSFIAKSSNTKDKSDKSVRSVDIEAMVEAYLPNVYAHLDADSNFPATADNSNSSSMATLAEQQQQPIIHSYQPPQQRPLSLGEESLRKAPTRMPITPVLRTPLTRDDPSPIAANNGALATPSHPPRAKQPIRSIDQLREAMSSLNLRRGLPSKEIGRNNNTNKAPAVGTPTVLTRRPSEPPRTYQQQQQQQQQQKTPTPETRKPMVLRRRSEAIPQRPTPDHTTMAPGREAAPPVVMSASKTLPTLTRRTARPQASFSANRRSSEEVQLSRNSAGSLSSMALGSLSSDRSYSTTSGSRPPLPSAYSLSTSPPLVQQQRPRAKSSRLDLRSRRDMTPLTSLQGSANDNVSNVRAHHTALPRTMPMSATATTRAQPSLSTQAPMPSSATSRLSARRSMININTGNRLSLASVNGGSGGTPYIQHRASYTPGSTDRNVYQTTIGTPTRLPPIARRTLSGDSQHSSSIGIPNYSTPRSSLSSGYYPMSAPPVRRSIDESQPLASGGMLHQQVSRKPSRRYRLDIRGVFGGGGGADTKDSSHNSLGVYPFC
ncbi:hypothetical protein LPJ81_000419 [Coemansia sp. IMI 209127]|nr:hypothetical protein LPJ81_000419 [Coemansia sp. IMI 209127]